MPIQKMVEVDYQVAKGTTLGMLREDVHRLQHKGYSCVGGITVQYMDNIPFNRVEFYLQPMVLNHLN